MPPLTLEGDTLGERHKYFNRLVRAACADKQFHLTKINNDESDIDNLLKIDTAAKTKNVDFIIDVLKCDDMLYISRAIKKSPWLITEQEYAHIIDPQYLYTELFPHMLTKAINKLLLHIRLHLKDEKRIEAFYEYLLNDNKSEEANKWLINCSLPFVENVIQNERYISLQTYKRLCRRSVKFLQYYTKVKNEWRVLTAVLFLMKSHTAEYLDILDKVEDYCRPSFGHKYTDIVMKKYPKRILDNFEKYIASVDLSRVAKHMKNEDIKNFVLTHLQNNNTKHYFSNYDNLKHFIKKMPIEDRYEFVKKTYIDRNQFINGSSDDVLKCCADLSVMAPASSVNSYHWYQYAPFNVAFSELKKIVRAESSPAERCAILSVLITCARKNAQNTKSVLEYYYEKHRNEPFKFKIQFVNNVIKQMPTHEFDNETWNILDKLFHTLEVYTESENNVQTCLQSVVLYKILNNENIPDIVEKKIIFDSFKRFHNQLNEEQQTKLFSYLLSTIMNKIQNKVIINESDFINVISLLTNVLDLLVDWKKDVKNYLFVLDKIKELIKLKKENAWNTDLRSLYTINKSWRRHMFEESMVLCPSEEVCLNALKHDPQLLVRHSPQVDVLRADHTVSLRRLLAKLRVYWFDTYAQQWINIYLNNLNKITEHKALVKSLFILLPQQQVLDMAKKYVPDDEIIEWSKIEQTELSLRKNIAKCLYVARPLTSVDVILWYAKGDYLQYAVPSLNAILHNISSVQSQKHMSKLLKAPVSLQKYGLQLAFVKLKYEELKPLFTDVWKTTKNKTIRTHIFTHTYNLLCKIKDPIVTKELWELLSMFIDNLAMDENKIIYSKLGNVKSIPMCIQGEFYMKSYNVLSSLPPGANCEVFKDNMINYAQNIMDLLDADFVETKMLASVEEKFSKSGYQCIDLISSYTLHGKTEEEQCERFQKVLLPALKHAFQSWNVVKDDQYVMKDNFDILTKALTWGVKKFLPLKKITVPVKLFSEIQKTMEQQLSIKENYERYTVWQLTTDYIKLVSEHNGMFSDPKLNQLTLADYGHSWLPDAAEQIWETLHIKVSPKFGPIIVKKLKEDTEKYFPTICWLFSQSLGKVFERLSFHQNLMKMETLLHMVLNEDFVPSYIVVCDEIPKYGNNDDNNKKKLAEIRKILSSHQSLEVQMHYHKAFADMTE